MKTLQEVQEFNRRKIICAVHGTKDYAEALKKELGLGCLVEVYMPTRGYIMPKYKQLHIINEFSKFEDKFVYEDVDCKNIRVVMEGKMVCDKDKIIGKPLTLDRVLLAIQRSSNWLAFWMNCHGDMIYEKLNKTNKRGKEIKIRWNLTEPTLEKQTKETQRAIYGLLGGKND